MRKALEWGGVITGIVLIGFGIGALVMSANARNDVQSELKQQQIVGTPDMTPKAISAEAKQAGLAASVSLPTCDVAGKTINDGSSARCFAGYMRIHALEATGGKTYAEMPRYATADGKGTNDTARAQKGANGQPLDNPVRNVWVTETALATALNVAYMGEQLSLFGIVVGIALILSGIGFIVLALGGALRHRETAAAAAPAKVGEPAVSV